MGLIWEGKLIINVDDIKKLELKLRKRLWG